MLNIGANLTSPYELAAIKGAINGVSNAHIFGHHPAVGTSELVLWHHTTDFVFPPSASVMTVSSDDATDTSAGTGARTVVISGLLADGTPVDETVILNGLTAVNTTNSFWRINSFKVVTVGTNEVNAGIIYIGTGTVTAGEPAVVYSLISADHGVAHVGVFTVPLGDDAYIQSYDAASGSAKTVDVSLYVRPSGESIREEDHVNFYRTPAYHTFSNAKHFEPLTDIWLTATSDATATVVIGSIDILLIKQGT